MSIDRSLKLKGALVRHRNVLTRGERIVKLKDEEKWEEGDSLFGLAKVANRKVAVTKKKEAKAAAVEGEIPGIPGTEGAPGTAAPAAGKPGAPAGKAAAPAKAPAGAKVAPIKAAPAAKSTGQGKPGGGGGGRR